MARAQRLLDLIQILRRHRYPVPGAVLAAQLGISLRTLYRDIATLQAQGASIDAEPGMGYVLRPGFVLPPLMFSEEEIEALVLGSRWVARRAGDSLATAARNALAKIAAVLPDALRESLDASTLLVGPGSAAATDEAQVALLRQAIRAEHKVEIDYRDQHGAPSARTIWPFALGFFDHALIVLAWCELRQAFRNFRVDRITGLLLTGQPYPGRRQALLKAWREAENAAMQPPPRH
ncbi:helix-turn-helix transcriptional regulator [Bordetella sp. 2513F-2]